MNEWISVDDRLPGEQYSRVLVWLADPNVSPVQWSPQAVKKYINSDSPAWTPTHWMPLPEPPKKEKKADDLP